MKLVYIANARMPHNRAHSVQIAKMSEAYNSKVDTTLIVPLKSDSSKEKTYASYGIKSRFRIKYVPSIDLVFLHLGILPFYMQAISFSFLASFYSLFIKKDYYYTRDIFTAFFLCLSKFIHKAKIVYECHSEPTRFEKPFTRWTTKRLDGMVFLNGLVAEQYKHVNKKKIIAPDGVDLSHFSIDIDQNQLKTKLNLGKNKIVLYSGHLYEWKGIYVLLDSTKYLPHKFTICILGGTPADITKVKSYINANSLKNIVLLGYVDYPMVSEYLLSSDILVLPNSSKDKFSNVYTSPLKLFEYMASGKIIVSSDLPSIRQILNKDNSILVEPDDPKALAEGIKKAASKSSHILALKAMEEVVNYTWDLRAKNIIDFINK